MKVKPEVQEKVRSSLLHMKTMLRREHKMPIKNYVMPFACIGPITEEEKQALVNQLKEMGYKVEIQPSIFSPTSHLLIDWTNRDPRRADSICSLI